MDTHGGGGMIKPSFILPVNIIQIHLPEFSDRLDTFSHVAGISSENREHYLVTSVPGAPESTGQPSDFALAFSRTVEGAVTSVQHYS